MKKKTKPLRIGLYYTKYGIADRLCKTERWVEKRQQAGEISVARVSNRRNLYKPFDVDRLLEAYPLEVVNSDYRDNKHITCELDVFRKRNKISSVPL